MTCVGVSKNHKFEYRNSHPEGRRGAFIPTTSITMPSASALGEVNTSSDTVEGKAPRRHLRRLGQQAQNVTLYVTLQGFDPYGATCGVALFTMKKLIKILKNLGDLLEALDVDDSPTLHMDKSLYELGSSKLDNCLIGKIFGARPLNRDGLFSTIQKVWHFIQGFDIELVDVDNIFMFEFHNKADRRIILIGSPWNFDNKLIILVKPSDVGDISEIDFSKAPFWIQIFKVPLAFRTESTKHIGYAFGKVGMVDLGDLGDCEGNFFMVRITQFTG
ncbi:hypothetical protein Sjap_022305 [Stephania japonica]|uniref:DUF4283 domain-containing protein n=1 Tax=Stephania japonica TaxID=461633 RepID=A0AAP0HPR5_9MAGN